MTIEAMLLDLLDEKLKRAGTEHWETNEEDSIIWNGDAPEDDEDNDDVAGEFYGSNAIAHAHVAAALKNAGAWLLAAARYALEHNPGLIINSHPLPWRQGNPEEMERPWIVLDAKNHVVIDCCSNDWNQTREDATTMAAEIVANANGVLS
jgi:hypothetical protein